MFHHSWHFGGWPPPPRVHFECPNGSPSLNAKYARKKYGRSAQSGRMTSPIESSPRPKWLNRTLRERSRSTSCSAFHDGAASSGASKSFSIHAEYRFSVPRFQVLRAGQTLPSAAPGRGGWSRRTAISRVIVPHSAGARSRASVARHVPAAGDATSANQKYGGPPCRSRDLAATLPSGAISESSPSSGFSAARSATARPRARRHPRRCRTELRPGRPLPREGRRKMRLRAATMLSRQQHTGVLETIEPPTLRPQPNNIAVLWLNHGKSIVSRVAAGSGLGRFCGHDVPAICPLRERCGGRHGRDPSPQTRGPRSRAPYSRTTHGLALEG